MSTQIIMILAGFVLVAIALIALSKNAMKSKVGIPIVIIGVAMVIFGSYSSDMVMSNTQMEQVATGNKLVIEEPVKQVKIISPIDQDSVKCRILTMGLYPEGHTKDIWVVIRPEDDRYYPQSDHTNTSFKNGGEWQVVTRFGGEKGMVYDIIVYEADAEASAIFTKTIEEWKEKEVYPGIELASMPKGAIEIERIKVFSSKNCRGVF